MPPIYKDKIFGLRRPLVSARRPSRFARPAEIKIRVRPDALDIDAQPVGDVFAHPVGNDIALDDVVNKLLLRLKLAREFGLLDIGLQKQNADIVGFHVLRS